MKRRLAYVLLAVSLIVATPSAAFAMNEPENIRSVSPLAVCSVSQVYDGVEVIWSVLVSTETEYKTVEGEVWMRYKRTYDELVKDRYKNTSADCTVTYSYGLEYPRSRVEYTPWMII